MTASVSTIRTPPKPSRKLGTPGTQLWKSITGEYYIDDANAIELLTLICQALDRAESARELIDKDGETVVDSRGIIREHPLLKAELSNRAFVMKGLQRLGLDTEPARATGRPPGMRG